jgi:hypothetical protein
MKAWHYFTGAAGCVVLGSSAFLGSFHQTVTTELVSPYSTQAAHFTHELPQPLKAMMRWGGMGVALGGGLLLINRGLVKIQDKLAVLQHPPALLPPATSTSIPISPAYQGSPLGNHLGKNLGIPPATAQDRDVKVSPPLPVAVPTAESASGGELPSMGGVDSSHCEYEAVLGLVDQGAVQFIGGKGSGKTEKQGWLIAEHLKRGHLVWYINIFAAGIHYKGLKVFGRQLNYRDAADGFRKFINEAITRLVNRAKPEPHYVDPFDLPHIHLGVDELSSLGRHLNDLDPTLMADFWEICNQFLRQVNMSVSLAGHGDTQVLMGGEKALKGKTKSIRRDIVRIYCQWITDPTVQGKRRCAGVAQMVWWEGEQEISKRINIPNWMRAPNPQFDFSALVAASPPHDPLASEFSKYRPPTEDES